jgi:hypothetical protein
MAVDRQRMAIRRRRWALDAHSSTAVASGPGAPGLVALAL